MAFSRSVIMLKWTKWYDNNWRYDFLFTISWAVLTSGSPSCWSFVWTLEICMVFCHSKWHWHNCIKKLPLNKWEWMRNIRRVKSYDRPLWTGKLHFKHRQDLGIVVSKYKLSGKSNVSVLYTPWLVFTQCSKCSYH